LLTLAALCGIAGVFYFLFTVNSFQQLSVCVLPSPWLLKTKALEDVPGHSIAAHNVTAAGIFKRFID